jgi:adenosylcobinamide-phosphate synthase
MELDRIAVLAIAAGLDFVLGDPETWLHPVQVIGAWIQGYSWVVLKTFTAPIVLKLAGVVLAGATLIGTGLVAWGLGAIARQIHPLLGLLTESIILASCFAGRSLREAAETVLASLETQKLEEARSRLMRYVGRDTQELSEAEVLRAVLETVTENATDGVMAPLFYAILGASLPMGSAPLALTYKAASTLDSMVGYKTPPYADLGWCSARLEDGLTWIPCRLTVVTIALISGHPRRVWTLCCRDAPQDPSPNAGWSECAYAAALGVQVGGVNTYQGVVKVKPLLGEPTDSITPERIQRAIAYTRWSFLLWLLGAIGILLLLQMIS